MKNTEKISMGMHFDIKNIDIRDYWKLFFITMGVVVCKNIKQGGTI